MDDITTTQGLVAVAAAVVAVVALLLALGLWAAVRRLRAAQTTVLGEHGATDLVGHAATLSGEFANLHAYVEDAAARLHERMAIAEERLDGSLSYRALVRYDAYGEMSGRQSASIALLDATRSGIVISSIHHRETARLYAKRVERGTGEIELSPEEAEAVRRAMAGETGADREPAA